MEACRTTTVSKQAATLLEAQPGSVQHAACGGTSMVA
jgi:hypothetical protein